MRFETVKPEDYKNKGRTSSLQRIVGGTPEKQDSVLKERQYIYESPQDVELYQYRLEKGPELEEIIRDLDVRLRAFLKEWGLEKDIKVTPEHVEILDKERLSQTWVWIGSAWSDDDISQDDKLRGKFDKDMQKVGINGVNPLEGKLKLVMTIAHEMVHFQAFQSLTIADISRTGIRNKAGEKGEGALACLSRRSGFRLTRTNLRAASPTQEIQETILFSALDEAITEELTKRFMEQCGMEIESIKNDFKKFKAGTSFKKVLSKILKFPLTDGYYYLEHRELLKSIIDGIFQHGKGQYKTRDDVFRLFTQAALNGRLLPVARKIEEVYGKGTFKKLGRIQHLGKIPKLEDL